MDLSQRTEPPYIADERETLTGFLRFQRETLAWKCSGLTPDQLRERAVPPSTLSLLGLVRHMTDVERGWFARVIDGADAPPEYQRETRELDTDFEVEDADIDEAFRLWHKECARSVAIVEKCESLDALGTHRPDGTARTVRWILTHMIEEYARHNGHADFLRERIDGNTGE